jgi:hypothetical protein
LVKNKTVQLVQPKDDKKEDKGTTCSVKKVDISLLSSERSYLPVRF